MRTESPIERRYVEAGYTLPEGWTWSEVDDHRSRYEISSGHVPLAQASGVVAWGVPMLPYTGAMKEWITYQLWPGTPITTMDTARVLGIVERHYPGGIPAFMRDEGDRRFLEATAHRFTVSA